MDNINTTITKHFDNKSSSESMFKIIKMSKTLWILSLAGIIISMVSQNITINQYARAVLKLTIMQLLDLNTFNNLLHDSCLMYNENPKFELIKSDCYTCESIDKINVIINPEEILDSYAELNWPVIYTSNVKTNVSAKDITLGFLTDDYLPCNYESNLKVYPLRALEINSGWFMHWRNCDDILGKKMRSIHRPDLFLSVLSETWTIMSSKYKTVHYKKINIYYDSRVAVSQLRGTFSYQLMPKNLCSDICQPLNGHLETYQILIFNSFIWDFQYLPVNNSTESIAIIYYLD